MADEIRETRYAELGYRCDGPKLWRIYDQETGCAVGPQYRSKAELFGDLDRFAGVFGAMAPAPRPYQETPEFRRHLRAIRR
jgi:hypothetical protein